MRLFKIIVSGIVLIHLSDSCFAGEFVHIMNDECIDVLYKKAVNYFKENKDFEIKRDPRGIILRFGISNTCEEIRYINTPTYRKILLAEDFLAKIKNPAIIEVHTRKASCKERGTLKNWEISTVIANNIESIVLTPNGKLSRSRINSVGYGEFLPAKNTPNNGSNYTNRVDIIILCNVSGE